MNRKIKAPDIAESVFDIGYLTFDLIAGIVFLINASGRTLFLLYGILTLILGIGDGFHLIPRVIKALKGTDEKVKVMLGKGLEVSSITMTVFYVILMYIWKYTFNLEVPAIIFVLVWLSAIARIIICLLPQNNWCGNGNMKLSLLRNSVFLITGAGIITLYIISGNANNYHLYRMAIAITISFACYIPVTLLSKKKPMIGMLMIPKTCAYIWMIVMGLELL